MRRALTPAIPPKLYRHFVLVTVAATAALAMFADGENREAITSQLQARQQENAVRRESYARFGAPKLGGIAAQPPGHFGDDEVEFGRPMENPRGGQSSSVGPGDEQAEAAGYSPEYLASLSPEERELLLKGLRDSGMLSEEQREQRGAALVAASAHRSGAAGAGD